MIRPAWCVVDYEGNDIFVQKWMDCPNDPHNGRKVPDTYAIPCESEEEARGFWLKYHEKPQFGQCPF